ncbi:MAG TPA: S9 family peptidase [Bacteroidetes bacterium]|nr:S9 family peptidase [Bacteroidota bacterium]
MTMLLSNLTFSQEKTGYQMPPKAIADLIDAAPTPGLSISPDDHWLLLMERASLPSIGEVSQEELRLAGLRINPETNGQSRTSHFTNIKIKPLGDGEAKTIAGLPENGRISSVSWSPDSKHFAFLNTVGNGIELWVADAAAATAKRMSLAIVNAAVRGSAFSWFSDGQHIIFKQIDPRRGSRPKKPAAPTGPVIQSNEGDAAPVRTYQDMLRNPFDERLFAYYTTSQLMVLDISTGVSQQFGEKGIYRSVSPSPDGNFVMTSKIKQPFSYIVPYYRFASETSIFDLNGKLVRQMADLPAAENLPKGFNAVATGPRSFNWRADKPASLYWVEAQDGGDPKKEAEIRDKMFFLDAPFAGRPKEALSFNLRYGGITWGSGKLAIAYEWWRADRREVTRRWQPDNLFVQPEVLFDRSYEDRYGDPGSFETRVNKYGKYVLLTADNGQSLYLTGQGASPEGNRPFVDKFNLGNKETERLWRSEAPYYEYPLFIIDAEKGTVMTRRETNTEPPNYFIRNLKTGQLTQLTHFKNPFEPLKGVDKELIKFKRKDGIEMSGTLYLPAGYDKEKDGPLPMLMWAYPREYKSASAASQVTTSPHAFIRTSWASPTLWVAQGYAVFSNVSMPVVGEGDEEPNETFVEQLGMNAEAAINKVVKMGVADKDKIAIGGHSYGAFMTANLLAHTDLFAAGIARSGAYNRTLTPFGFQSEERTYWEAPEVYYNMSPFNFADKIKEPLLLIHGEADNNSGTYPMQSERMYAALKGHGATVRLVMLPAESHGYRARESVMHMAWEMDSWLEKYVKKGEKP